jgi:parvulin-like peptidyl-prolyl isomerase
MSAERSGSPALGIAGRRLRRICRVSCRSDGARWRSAAYLRLRSAFHGSWMGVRALGIVPLGLLVLLAVSCHKRTEPEGIVLARVGSATLDLGAFASVPADSILKGKEHARLRSAVQNWVENQLLAQEAIRRGLENDPAILQELERLRSQLLANAVLERMLPDTFHVGEDEIRSYYERNREDFRRAEEEVRLQQILVPQRFLAEEIYSRASQGEDFATLAQQYSQGAWAAQGGYVGSLPMAQLPEKFRRLLVGARPGQVLRPIQVEDGFVVIKVLGIYPAGSYLELDEVRSRIEMELKRQKYQAAYRELIRTLSSRTDVWINEEVLGRGGRE